VTVPPSSGPQACGACGRELAPGVRFCTGCGSPAQAAAEPPPATVELPALEPREREQWALGTPPAGESWWRNPIVLVATAVTLLLGGGVASWKFFLDASEPASLVRQLPASDTASADASAPAEQEAGEEDPFATPGSEEPADGQDPDDVFVTARALQQILARSQAGRAAALQQRDYGAALRNREQLLRELDGLAVPPEPARLAQAYATLREAIEASARADEQHLACGCDDVQPADEQATQLKRRFAELFDPYARRYFGGPVDPSRI
jgi:hypothetical protein